MSLSGFKQLNKKKKPLESVGSEKLKLDISKLHQRSQEIKEFVDNYDKLVKWNIQKIGKEFSKQLGTISKKYLDKWINSIILLSFTESMSVHVDSVMWNSSSEFSISPIMINFDKGKTSIDLIIYDHSIWEVQEYLNKNLENIAGDLVNGTLSGWDSESKKGQYNEAIKLVVSYIDILKELTELSNDDFNLLEPATEDNWMLWEIGAKKLSTLDNQSERFSDYNLISEWFIPRMSKLLKDKIAENNQAENKVVII